MRKFKRDLKDGEILVCGDFAENFTYVVQNGTQGQHWNNSQATIHPIVCYYRSENELKHFSYVCISDKMENDTMAVRTFMKHLIDFMKMKLGPIKNMIYFTDGCSAQYKNKENLFNLCLHEDDFGIEAEWHFFATSHGKGRGKGPCDGVGGTVKREARRASLQSPFRNLIGSAKDLYYWCKGHFKSIEFRYVPKSEIQDTASHKGTSSGVSPRFQRNFFCEVFTT